MGLIEKYVFRGDCKLTPSADGVNETVRVSGPCYNCGKEIEVTVVASDLESFRRGNYASACFPYLSPGSREFLISGICDACWDEMWGEDNEE